MNHMALRKKLRLTAGKKPMTTISYDFKALVKDGGFNTINGIANSVDNFLDSSTELKLYEWRKMQYLVDMFNSIIPLVLHLNIPSNNCLSHASKYHKVVDMVKNTRNGVLCVLCTVAKEKRPQVCIMNGLRCVYGWVGVQGVKKCRRVCVYI